MNKLILRNFQSPGDIVMLTAAVRDLHLCCPGSWLVDVRTSCPQLWERNPYLTPLDEDDPDVETIDCHYPLIHRSNHAPYHFIHGFIEFLNERLGLNVKPTAFKGDIHLSDQEKSWISQVHEQTGEDTRFWIVVSGGKYDFTAKWWDPGRFQKVIDCFQGDPLFVQVGEAGHHHPPLEGALDLRGKTDLRQLVRLVYHAAGVLTPVNLLMHLAAAVETKPGMPKNRPCVTVAGGREPPHWEAYPHHQFLHTNGALPCCDDGGCWKSRVKPLGDGDANDDPDRLCVDVVGDLPRCMDLITAEQVIASVALYCRGGRRQPASATPSRKRQPKPARPAATILTPLTEANALDRAHAFIAAMPPYPGGFHGRGVVIPAGGVQYFTNAWVCVHILRQLGCRLPIQVWHLGPLEMDQTMIRLLEPLDVACVDARAMRQTHPARILNGWELKPYAILHAPFREILLLDADNVPVANPEFLFDTPQYRDAGALFWPDFHRLEPERKIWRLCGVAYRDEPEFESGQIVIDKQRHWRALNLAMWYNQHSDFFYRYIHGDKETYHLAFRKLEAAYAMPERGILALDGVMCQHDFEGARLFQHRNMDKWNLLGDNRAIADFWLERDCLRCLDALRGAWDGRIGPGSPKDWSHWSEPIQKAAGALISGAFAYCRVGYDQRAMTFRPDGAVGQGAAELERYWTLHDADGETYLELASENQTTCMLRQGPNGSWTGAWLHHERMPIELSPR